MEQQDRLKLRKEFIKTLQEFEFEEGEQIQTVQVTGENSIGRVSLVNKDGHKTLLEFHFDYTKQQHICMVSSTLYTLEEFIALAEKNEHLIKP